MRAFAYLSAATVITTTGLDGRQAVEQVGYASDNTMTSWARNGQSVLGTSYDGSFSPGLVTDGNGQRTETLYTTQGLPLTTTNALDEQLTRAYDSHNNLLETTDALGVRTLYRYNAANQVISTTVGVTTTSSMRATTLYTYTAEGRLLETRAPDGVVRRNAYDTLGQVISTTVGYGTPLAQTTSYGYDTLGRVVTTIVGFGTPLARTDVIHYNADNTVAQTIENYQDGIFTPSQPDKDVVTTYGYDVLGRTVSVTDTLGQVQLTHYNAAGREDWSTRNAVPALFDTHGVPLYHAYSAAAPDQNVTTLYGYDGLGRTVLLTETGILSGTFNPTTLQFSTTTTRVTRSEYDTLSRPLTATLNYRPGLPASADTNIALYTRYDGAGNVITQTDALGRWTVTQYDALNRPITSTLNYDDGDPLTGPSDADLVSVMRYDAAGRVVEQIDNYDDGNFSATEPITDRITLYQYDTLNRVVTTTLNYAQSVVGNDLNRISATAYDSVSGRVAGMRDALERWVSQQYDLLGRVTATIANCRVASVAQPSGCDTAIRIAMCRRGARTTRWGARRL